MGHDLKKFREHSFRPLPFKHGLRFFISYVDFKEFRESYFKLWLEYIGYRIWTIYYLFPAG